MKVLCGDIPTLVGLVRKRVTQKIDELEDSLEQETQERMGRTRDQARQLRDQILEAAAKDAQAARTQQILSAQQEAKQMLVHAKGRMESAIIEEVREELTHFVKGERDIGKTSYEALVKKALDKSKTKLKIVKHEDGVVLVGTDLQLDLRVDSMLERLGALPLPEVKPVK